MSCFSCFRNSQLQSGKAVSKVDGTAEGKSRASAAQQQHSEVASEKFKASVDSKKGKVASKDDNSQHIAVQTFTFRELAAATKNFRPECLLGEGGFGRVYKGRLEGTGQIVAVKQLDRNGLQGNREFLVEVLMLSLLHHHNLVNLTGYCADGDQRLLVYEYMPLGSLEDHLHDLPSKKEPLDWNTRMRIAAGAVKGLEYLHDTANPPVIYRDLKCSNILLDEGYHPKLSDFGLAKLGPVGDKTHVSTRVMGTYGYCAPEYAMTGQLTLKSDIYSFGVVLLELITGRKAIDNTRPTGEHNLVAWARPLFKDRRKFPMMADPMLEGRYPMRGLYQALAVAAMCMQEQATARPLAGDVATALTYLASQVYDPGVHPVHSHRFEVHGPGKENKNEEAGSKVVRLPHGSSDGYMKDNESAPNGATDVGGPAGGSGRRDSVQWDNNYGLNDQDSPRHGTKITTDLGGLGGRSGRRRDSVQWDKYNGLNNQDSPRYGSSITTNAELKTSNSGKDRERVVAEARTWGENWREKRGGSKKGSFDAGTG